MDSQRGAGALSRRFFLGNVSASALALPLGACAPPLAATPPGSRATGSSSPPASGAVGRPAPKLTSEPPFAEDKKVGWAVVGLGKLTLGDVLPAFGECRFSKLAAVVSGNPEKARATAASYGLGPDAIYDYAGFDKLARDPRVDVVYIVLPNSLHAEFTVRAFRAGKHVLCEKPMASSIAECEAMIRASDEAKRRFMIAYRSHYEPHNREAIRILRKGELGELRAIVTSNGRHANPDDPADQWRLRRALAGGGSLIDIGIYGLNGARYLAGEEPIEVRAQIDTRAGDPRFREVEDVVAWQMRFPSGLLSSSTTSYSYATTSRFEVMGTKGQLLMDPATPYRGNRLLVKTDEAQHEPKIDPVNQFAREMDHFSEAILRGTPIVSTPEEGLQDVRLILAIYESARTGKPVATNFGYKTRVGALTSSA